MHCESYGVLQPFDLIPVGILERVPALSSIFWCPSWDRQLLVEEQHCMPHGPSAKATGTFLSMSVSLLHGPLMRLSR
jgi:hypothetical protein